MSLDIPLNETQLQTALPLQSIKELIENLASKRDLETLVETLVDKFKTEIQLTFESLRSEITARDQVIDNLKIEINELKDSKLDHQLELNRLSLRIDGLEQGLTGTDVTDVESSVNEGIGSVPQRFLDDNPEQCMDITRYQY